MKSFFNVFDDVKKFFVTLNTKKILIIVCVLLLIIAPTLFAVGSIIYHNHLYTSDLFSVTIYSDDGTQLDYDEKEIDSAESTSLSFIFYEMTVENKIPNTLPQKSEQTPYVRAVTKINNDVSEYRCYFSADDLQGYYIDESGNSFIISEKLNKAFLSKECAEDFYSSSNPHTLMTADGDTITPKTIDWHYKNINGDYILANNNTSESKIKSYEVMGTLNMIFEQDPDECSVVIYDGDNKLFDGKPENLSEFIADSKDPLRVTVDARWDKKDDSENYGSLSYEFYIVIKNRSSFSISSDSINVGGLLMIKCTNITDVSKIAFESNIESIKPTFKKYDASVCALIQIPERTNQTAFKFNISYGASKQTFNVDIFPKINDEKYSYNSDIFSSNDQPSKENVEITKFIKELKLPQNQTVYFRGNFTDPAHIGFTALYTHDSTVYWGEESQHSYTALGNCYAVSSHVSGGLPVNAIQNGIVCYVGNSSLLGNFVVIDHGFGIRTWYGGLSSIDTRLGSMVRQGQQIGKTGDCPITEKEGFRLYCSLNDSVIDPKILFKNISV